jgi:hypothetical protein
MLMQDFNCTVILIRRSLQFHVEWTNFGNFRIENLQSQALLNINSLTEYNFSFDGAYGASE